MCSSIYTVLYEDGRKELYVDGKLVSSMTPAEYIREMKEKFGIDVGTFTW